MKTGVLIGIIAVVVVIAAGVFYFAYFNKGYSSNSMGNPTAGGTGATGSGTSITIQNFAFSPQTLNVKAGDTVTWTNEDSVGHKIASDTGSELGSDTLQNGATYSHTFSAAGTYAYHCAIHPSMKGTIVVS